MKKPLLILAAVAAFVVVLALPKKKPPLPTTPVDPAELIATISHGETVDLDAQLQPGEWTLVEYYADW